MASNVITEKTYIERFFQPNLNFNSPISSENIKYLFNQSNFASDLIPFLYYHYNESPIENIEKIIKILSNNSEKDFKNKFGLEFGNNYIKVRDIYNNSYIYRFNPIIDEDYLKFLHRIRTIIISYNELKLEEKGELCRLERFFMKKYLEKIRY